MRKSNLPNEIFRHFRPLQFGRRGEVGPQRNGGISFRCLQHDDSSIDFWVYICPLTAGFSAKEAVRRLRENAEKASPWGHFVPTDEPLIFQLVQELTRSELTSAHLKLLLLHIIETNMAVETKVAQLATLNTKNEYATD